MKKRLLTASVFALAASAAVAQDKNSGVLLPTQPAARPAPAVRPYAAPRPPAGGTNPQAEQLSQTLRIDPATADLRDNRPADVAGTEGSLGLRPSRGPHTDLRGRTPSSREIVDALAPR